MCKLDFVMKISDRINSHTAGQKFEELRNNLTNRVKTAIPNPQTYLDTKKEEMSQKIQEKVQEKQNTIPLPNVSHSSLQTGGLKDAKRNIKLTTQRIKRTIKKFCNRHNKTKKCRRKHYKNKK